MQVLISPLFGSGCSNKRTFGVMQMKQELRQIYHDLSNGKLSQREALDKIKAIKLKEQGKRSSALLAVPVWEARSVEKSAEGNKIECREHHVMVCELGKGKEEQLESLLGHGRCWRLQAGEDKNIAERYSEYALACFERIQEILQGKPQGKVLVQVVIG